MEARALQCSNDMLVICALSGMITEARAVDIAKTVSFTDKSFMRVSFERLIQYVKEYLPIVTPSENTGSVKLKHFSKAY